MKIMNVVHMRRLNCPQLKKCNDLLDILRYMKMMKKELRKYHVYEKFLFHLHVKQNEEDISEKFFMKNV